MCKIGYFAGTKYKQGIFGQVRRDTVKLLFDDGTSKYVNEYSNVLLYFEEDI